MIESIAESLHFASKPTHPNSTKLVTGDDDSIQLGDESDDIDTVDR